MFFAPFPSLLWKKRTALGNSGSFKLANTKAEKEQRGAFVCCVSFHYKRSDCRFQTVSSPVFLSGSRYSVWFFNIPYTIFTKRLAMQINAWGLFLPSSSFFRKYSRNTGFLGVPLGDTCTIWIARK